MSEHERVTVIVHETLSPLLTDTLGFQHGWDAAEGVAAAILERPKRLTEAELAAEFEAARCDWMVHQAKGSYWAPVNETWPTDYESAANRATTLLRFASLPHYDEENE